MLKPATPVHRRLGIFAAVVAAVVGSASCGSQTSTSTAPSPLLRCGVTLNVSDATLPADGGSGQLTVTTERECAWTARSDASWLTVVGPVSGQGNGTVEYRAGVNPDPVTRRGTIALNESRAEVSQSPGECRFTLAETGTTFAQAGGAGTVRIQASSSLCSWTASVDAEWVRITPPGTGQGSGTVSYEVLASSGPPRVATLRVGGQRFDITQAEGCTYTAAPDAHTASAAGGTGVVTVSTGAGCPWVAGSNAEWITITSAPAGTGPGTVSFSVAPTSGPLRVGTLLVAGRSITITQTQGCTYEVAPLGHTVESTGGTRTISVTAANGCQWTAQTGESWIGITGGASGSGSGTVTFTVAPSSGPARSGTLTVAGRTVTVAQSQGCSYAIAPESQTVAAAGGNGEVQVTAGNGCAWTASSAVQWISITEGASGSGNGTVKFSVAPTTGPERTGTLTIGGRTFTVTQGQGCSLTLSPDRANVPANGGPTSFAVQAAAGCTWTAASAVPWITIASGASGTGNGTVALTVAANSGAPRIGTVTVAGRTFTVEQQGNCSYTLSRTSQTVPAGGGTGTVSVTAQAGCAWTATTPDQWITVTSGASGSGNGSVGFSVAPNTGPARTGSLDIAGQKFTVTQESACTYAINPQQHAAASAGGSVTVNVAALAGCPWTAVSGDQWITIAQGASGSGNGVVQVTIAPNTGPDRTGSANIAGQKFIVLQASGCTYALSPTNRDAPAGGQTASVTVTAGAGCEWTATTQTSWISVIGNGKGTGNGQFEYRVTPNNSEQSRTGTITVQNQVFTVRQEGGD